MRGLLLLALAVIAPNLAMASVAAPPPPTLAPAKLVSFAPPPARVECARGAARLVEGAPLPIKVWQPWVPPVPPVGAVAYVPPPPATSEVYTFSVDADGHVVDLKRQASPNVTLAWTIDEQAAVLASWRFAAGAPAEGCKVDLAPTYAPLAEASPARLFEALAADPRNVHPALRKALGGDCAGPTRRRPQVMVYPDMRPFEDRSVDPPWAGLSYDIDAGGTPRNLRIVAQHGETALGDTAAAAIADSRFFPGPPRSGCFVAFKALPKATPAPKRPSGDSFERPGDACKVSREALNIPEAKTYPPAFGKQRVAGWAILRFDVAPWGQVGAVEVLAAQPTETFGVYARNLLQGARPTPPPSGYRGCVVPIIYAIPVLPDDEY